MSVPLETVASLVVGIAMIGGGVWCLRVKLPAERMRQRRMVPASGVIQDGLGANNVFKRVSGLATDAADAAVPMVAYTTRDGTAVVTEVGGLRTGHGSRRTVFAIGQPVELKYDPADPKVVVLDGQPDRTAFPNLICAFLLLTGALLAYASLRDLL